LAWASYRPAVGALRFSYEVTLGRRRRDFALPMPNGAKRLPQILRREEVTRLLDRTENLKHRVLLMATYAAGRRLSEVVRLRVPDIDSPRMLLRVEQGKGKKDRYSLLSQRLLVELRRYYRGYGRPSGCLPTAGDPPRWPRAARRASTRRPRSGRGFTRRARSIPFVTRSRPISWRAKSTW